MDNEFKGDSPEQIQRCLHCKYKECINCLDPDHGVDANKWITRETTEQIKAEYEAGNKKHVVAVLAKRYGVSKSLVYRVVKGTWNSRWY